MTVREIMKLLDLKLAAGEDGLSKQIEDVYVCDLLSWVMANASAGSAWVTIQTHSNIVAVASLKELSCIILPENAEMDEAAKIKADQEAMPILVSKNSGYNVCCSLYDALKDK